MKNLTIKKVALGVFLAGYAASSAFAASLDATSKNVIYGNAPSISSLKDLNTSKESRIAHRLSVRITTDEDGTEPVGTGSDNKNTSKKIHVGNYVHLKYNLDDFDNDSEKANEGSIVKTIKIFKRIKVNNVDTWSNVGNVTALNVTYKTETDNNKTYAVIRFKITDEFSGADKIGFKLLESTEFGLPAVNSWVSVSDILSHADPKVDSAIAGNGHSVTNPDKVGPAEEDIQAGDYGTGDWDTNNPIGPVVGKDFVVGLFGYDGGGAIDLTKNYKITDEPLHYGQKYSVLVWKDKGATETPPDNDNLPQFPDELDVTTNYAYEWFLVGTVEGVTAETTALTSQLSKRVKDNDTILLGADASTNATVERNSIYASTYKAGAQGFQLKVTAD